MIKRRSNYLTLASLVVVSLLSVTVLVNVNHAIAANGITISPPLKEITLGPGLLETSTYVTLQNNTNQQVRAKLQLVDLRALGEFGGTSLDKAGLTDKYDLANWMTLPGGDTVVIASGETVKVKVNITNRDDLRPGGHYGAVIVTTSNDNAVKSDVNINQQLVSLLFVKKLGGETYGLELESFSQEGSGVPQQVTTRFKSTGNVHVIPRGYIEVTDPEGKLVAKGILNEDSNIILPDNTRQFVTLMQPVSTADKPGVYKTTVFYRYDGQNDFSSKSMEFTYGNRTAWIIAAALVGLLSAAVITYNLFIKRHSKIRKTSSSQQL